MLLLTKGVFCRTASWYEKVMRVNVIGTYLVTRTFLPLLLRRNTRTIVQISSGLGSISINRLAMTDPEKNPMGNRFIAYNASKAAINMREYINCIQLRVSVCVSGFKMLSMAFNRNLNSIACASCIDRYLTTVLSPYTMLHAF